jgi:hypothetical protein
MSNSFTLKTLLTPGKFYDPLSAADKTYLMRVPEVGDSIPLSGAQIQLNFLNLAKFGVDINTRVLSLESLGVEASSPQTGYVVYAGRVETEGQLYGGYPLSWTSSAPLSFPVTVDPTNYYEFTIKEGDGVIDDVPYLLSYGAENTAGQTYADSGLLATYLNGRLTSTDGFLHESADLTSFTHDWSTTPADFEIIIDDDSINTYTLTLDDNVTSPATARAAVELAIAAVGLTNYISVTLVSGKIRLVGDNLRCSRITIKKVDGQLEADSPLHLMGFLLTGVTTKTVYDFSEMFEFVGSTNYIIFRGKGRASTDTFTGGVAGHNLFSLLGMSSHVPVATETETIYHTQRPTTSYPDTLNFGGSFAASHLYTDGNLSVAGVSTLNTVTIATLLTSTLITSTGSLTITNGTLVSGTTTAYLFDSTVTTLNLGAVATAINVGHSTGLTTLRGNLKVAGLAGPGHRALYVDDDGNITVASV